MNTRSGNFIARAGYAASREAALQLVSQAMLDYPDARHHCWAYLLGDPQCATSAAMHDDGEPSGTAGKPVLNVLLQYRVECGFAIEQNIRHWLSQQGGKVLTINYADSVSLEIEFPEKYIQQWQTFAGAHKVKNEI